MNNTKYNPNNQIEHILYVFVMYCISIIFFGGGRHHHLDEEGIVEYFFSTRVIFSFISILSIFYINILYLIPRFFYKEKRIRYFIYIILFSLFVVVAHKSFFSPRKFFHILAPEQEPKHMRPPDFEMPHPRAMEDGMMRHKRRNLQNLIFIKKELFMIFVSLLLSWLFIIYQKNREQKYLQRKKEAESLKSEINLLRAQISPHFLFNMLNTLLSMAHKKSKKLPDVILQLSDMMRYMLYNSSSKVTLRDEVDFIKNYICLHNVRLGDKMNLAPEINIKDDSKLLEPMLIIPLLENAIKYGCALIKEPEISVNIYGDDSMLRCEIKNTFHPKTIENKTDTGIGLVNIKKRLEYLYPDKYFLKTTSSEENIFTACLTLYF